MDDFRVRRIIVYLAFGSIMAGVFVAGFMNAVQNNVSPKPEPVLEAGLEPYSGTTRSYQVDDVTVVTEFKPEGFHDVTCIVVHGSGLACWR